MTIRRLVAIAWSLLIVMSALPAFGEGAIGYRITNDILEGEPVTLTINVGVALTDLRVTVTRRNDKKTWEFTESNLGAGNELSYTWDQGSGSAVYDIVYSGETTDGRDLNGSASAEVHVVGSLAIEIDFRNTSLSEGQLAVQTDRGVTRAQLEVFGAEMTPIDSVEADLGKPKTRFNVTWSPTEDVPVLMELKVTEPSGIWAGLQIFRFEIPHEDVIFESGKHEIRDAEVEKLEETKKEIVEALETYERVDAQLYVSGYTDTVGSTADNQKLSQRRAKAIAKWFRASGIEVPIYYQGFGEEALIVPTGDNTDEARNRRAVYTLANSPPLGGVNYPRGKWKKLR